MTEKNTIQKITPEPRRVASFWWNKDIKVKKKRRRSAYKGIVTPDKKAELL
jgi:hypothetical protein